MDGTINFGDDAADARYRMQDTSSTGGNFVLAEDLDGGTVLLEYDYSASEWVSRGPVNLDGNDITNAGSVSADTLEAADVGITDRLTEHHYETDPSETSGSRSINTTYQNTTGTAFNVIVRFTATADSTSVSVNIGVAETSSAASNDANTDDSIETTVNTGGVSRFAVVLVPDRYYYRLNAFGDTADYEINKIYERRWQA